MIVFFLRLRLVFIILLGGCSFGLHAATVVGSSYSLSIGKNGSGTVTGDKVINCGTVCSAIYTAGTTVNLTAVASSGYIFSGWSGACTGVGVCTVAMSAAKSVVATFKVGVKNDPPIIDSLEVTEGSDGAVTVFVAAHDPENSVLRFNVTVSNAGGVGLNSKSVRSYSSIPSGTTFPFYWSKVDADQVMTVGSTYNFIIDVFDSTGLSIRKVSKNIKRQGVLSYPATPSVKYLLGTRDNVAGQIFDLAFQGADVLQISGVYALNQPCKFSGTRSNRQLIIFECLFPASANVEREAFYARVSYSNGALDTYVGPFYVYSADFWRQTNGTMFVSSLDKYDLTQTYSVGPVIDLKVGSVTGNVKDVPAAAGFNSLRVWAPGGDVYCPYSGTPWRYQCPVLPSGAYFFEILFDQSSRYIVGNLFVVFVEPPGQAVAPPIVTPAPNPTVVVCDIDTGKGCRND